MTGPGDRALRRPEPGEPARAPGSDTDHDRVDRFVRALRAAGCVFAEDEAELILAEATDDAHRERMLAARVQGMPLEQVLGWADFDGLRILLDPGVFVPRQRTRLLARRAAAIASARDVVVDLCCGSGAVGAAVATRVPGVELYAVDLDPAAVACARRNLEPLGASVYRGDLFEALPPAIRGRVRVLAVNAPYVPTDEIDRMPPEARDHEPLLALDGGADGLDVHRRVARDAAAWLAPRGSVVIETSRGQAATTASLFRCGGMSVETVTDADLDATVVIASRPAD